MSGTLVANTAIGFQFDAPKATVAINLQEEQDLIARLP